MRCDIGKLVSKEVVGNQMRVVGESLSLSSARRECGLVAGDQSAARLARVIIGHVGGDVHTETVARELVVHSFFSALGSNSVLKPKVAKIPIQNEPFLAPSDSFFSA